MKRTIENIFKDYLKLSSKNYLENLLDSFKGTGRDCFLENNNNLLVLLRRLDGNLMIYFLHDGSRIIIPKELCIIIKDFMLTSKDEVFFREAEKKVDKSILLLCKIVESSDTSIPEITFLDNVIELLKVGTEDIRNLVISIYDNLFIPPISYIMKGTNFEI